MSLDVYLEEVQPTEIYQGNITHNLNKMAGMAGIYAVVWRPDENDIKEASDLIEPLTQAIARLEADPEKYKALNPPNGWGTYEDLLNFLKKYLQACKDNPMAVVRASR